VAVGVGATFCEEIDGDFELVNMDLIMPLSCA
jgi:hypothetical protein